MRIVTLNLNYYVGKHGSWDQRKTLIIEVLKEKRPDIISFQAVAAHPDLYGGVDQASQIAEKLGGFQSHYFQEAQELPDRLVQGSAIISRLPLLEKSFHRLTLQQGSDDNSARVVQRTVFPVGVGRLILYNAHFSWVEDQAKTNVDEAMELTSGDDGSLSLMAGDFNNPPDNGVLDPFTNAGWTDAWKALRGDEAGYTFESDDPSSRIDYFWLSPGLAEKAKTVELISAPPDADVRLSDHLGVLLELDLNQSE